MSYLNVFVVLLLWHTCARKRKKRKNKCRFQIRRKLCTTIQFCRLTQSVRNNHIIRIIHKSWHENMLFELFSRYTRRKDSELLRVMVISGFGFCSY